MIEPLPKYGAQYVYPARFRGLDIVNWRLLASDGTWTPGKIVQGPLNCYAAAAAAQQRPEPIVLTRNNAVRRNLQAKASAFELAVAQSVQATDVPTLIIAYRAALRFAEYAETRGNVPEAKCANAIAVCALEKMHEIQGREWRRTGSPLGPNALYATLVELRNTVWYFQGAAAAADVQLDIQQLLSECLVLQSSESPRVALPWLQRAACETFEISGDLYLCFGDTANAGGQYTQALQIAAGAPWYGTVQLPTHSDCEFYVELPPGERDFYAQRRLSDKLALKLA